MSNLDAARSGDRREALIVLRDSLASAMDAAEPNVLAQLASQYRTTLAELASLPPVEGMSKRDELKARREARTATPRSTKAKAPPAPAKKAGKRRA